MHSSKSNVIQLPTYHSENNMHMTHVHSTKSYDTLDAFLKAHQAGKKDITHTSMTGGKYHIPDKRLQEFNDLFAKAVFANKEQHCIVERHGESGPIVVDLDIEFSAQQLPNSKHIYTNDIIHDFIHTLVGIVHSMLKIGNERKKNLLYVFEKPEATLKNTVDGKSIYKDGIHIMMPNVITSPEVQFLIRKQMLEHVEEYMIQSIEEQDCEVMNKAVDIYDESVIKRNGWILYGGSKPNKKPYGFTQIWNGDQCNFHKYTQSEQGQYPDICQELSMLFGLQHNQYFGMGQGASVLVNQLSIRGYTAIQNIDTTDYYESCKKQAQIVQKKEFEKRHQSNPWMTRCENENDLD